ncbi:hypothetical protein D3C71_1016290 [compost metagenome]
MISDQPFQIQPFNLPINHPPLAANHHPIRAIRTAQQQRRNRIVTAGEPQLIQLEQRQISLLARRNFTDVCATQQLRRTFGGPAQHAFRSDLLGAVAQALDVQSLTRFEDHVRGVVGGRTVHAKAQWRTGVGQINTRADAGSQAHVRARAMADTGAGRAEAGDFVRVEVDAVGQPGTRAEPADAVQIIHGAQAEALQAEVFFVEGFRQVRVQAHVELVRQFGTGGHDFRSHRKRRTGCQGDLDLRAVAAFVILGDQALAVVENYLAFLHGLLRWQATVLFAEAH